MQIGMSGPMLRYEDMPSDFNPMFLILGDGADLAELSAILMHFARDPQRLLLSDHVPGFHARTPLTIAPSDAEFGLRRVGGDLVWCLNAWQARNIADRIAALASDRTKSGSDIFEIGSEGEIPVKVSRGEFTDDFLVTKR
jgi:hypothetical protein